MLILVLLSTSSTLKAEVIYGKNYQLETSEPFGTFAKELRGFLDQADATYDSFFSSLGLDRQKNTEVKVIALPDKKALLERASQFRFAPGFVPSAFYARRQQEAYVYNAQDSRIYLSSLLHELSHHFIFDFLPQGHEPPACLNEGLAEVASSSAIRGTSVAFAPQTQLNSGRLVARRAEGNDLIELSELLGMNVSTFQALSGQTDSYPYSQCWALTRFLVDDQDGLYRGVLVALLTQKNPKKNFRKIVEGALPTDETFEAFEKAWISFAKNPR